MSDTDKPASDDDRSSVPSDPGAVDATGAAHAPGAFGNLAQERARLRRRRAAEFRFRLFTLSAVILTGGFLCFFIVDLLIRGAPALRQAEIEAELHITPEAVAEGREAIFAPEVRDLVSRAYKRRLLRDVQLPQVLVAVEPAALTSEDPAAAVRDLALTEADAEQMKPWVRRSFRPTTIPREHLLAMMGEAGRAELATLGAELEPEANDADGIQRVWLRGSDALESFMKDSSGFAGEVLESVETLAQAGFVRMGFNYRKYGEEGVIERRWVVADGFVDQYLKGYDYTRIQPVPEDRELTEDEVETRASKADRIERIERLHAEGRIALNFNRYFFLNGDSNIPEVAGMKAAVIGSMYVLALVFLICLPIGVMTSIYLEEFAPDNALTRAIEVNINNLAAIPSILFGVLGLAIFINFFGVPRNSVLIGGLVLALMTLPVVIISTRAALRAVPDSIRQAGFAMGATRWQVVLHHVLPSSVSGIMTGSIIGLAQAMGETAPLIMIGLVAFVSEPAVLPTDPTTVMPAQIFFWFNMPDQAFKERAALGILVLLMVLFIMNGLAVWIRARAERKW